MGSGGKKLIQETDDGTDSRKRNLLRKIFDKLAATKSSIGDPSCQPHARRAKHIARDICGQASAGVVDDSSGEGNDGLRSNENDVETAKIGDESDSVGVAKHKGKEGARGSKQKRFK